MTIQDTDKFLVHRDETSYWMSALDFKNSFDFQESFKAVTYTGNGGTQSITGVGFQPDFVWLKSRSLNAIHAVFDTVRGETKRLRTNDTVAEDTSTALTTFDADGFTLGNDYSANNSGSTFVAWCWKAGGAASSNTDGAITSSVSANTAKGFSVVTFTGTGATGTVGHGLSQAPEIYIRKSRSNAEDWFVYTTLIDGSLDFLKLNNTDAKTDSGASLPNATTFEVGAGEANGELLVTYCFHSVEGISKMGKYTGNGLTDGPFVDTGFRPAFVMIKNTSVAGSWEVYDAARDPDNLVYKVLQPNVADAEVNVDGGRLEFTSNGFKLRHTGGSVNGSGNTLIYMAFAEAPSPIQMRGK